MTHWQLKRLQKQRKKERKAQIIDILGAMLFGLVIGIILCFAR